MVVCYLSYNIIYVCHLLREKTPHQYGLLINVSYLFELLLLACHVSYRVLCRPAIKY